MAGTLPPDFELSPEFEAVFNAVENTRECIYLTGEAGTGKTTFLKYFRKHTRKKYVVLAPTGIAAINSNGQTLHSFFHFPPKLIQPEHVKFMKKKQELLTALQLLIIDEASMMRADLLDGVDFALRKNRELPLLPFGGVQVVLIGDLYQLPPVVDKGLAGHYPRKYQTPYFFSAKAFETVRFERFRLTKIYRQRDAKFTRLLNKIRTRTAQQPDLDRLNTRVEDSGHLEDCITLTPTNALANRINEARLEKLKTQEYEYPAAVNGDFDPASYPTETTLRLRAGAQVLMIKNDPDKRWVNGSVGEIVELKSDSIQIRIGHKTHEVFPSVWEKVRYEYDEKEDKILEEVAGSFEQYPLKLAWAITIHKSQGLTFEKIIVDFGDGAFASGQAYVALSRCRNFETLYLKRPVAFYDILLDPRIQKFEEQVVRETEESADACKAEAEPLPEDWLEVKIEDEV